METRPEVIEISRRMIEAGVQAFRQNVQAEKLVGDLGVNERARICVKVYEAMDAARKA